MQKKHGLSGVCILLSFLAVLMVTSTMQVQAENGWLQNSQTDILEEQNTFTVLTLESNGFAFDLTPVPSATTPADSCSNCDAFDMKVLSVTLTAISNNPDKTSTPSNNNLPASLIVFGIIFSIALVVLIIIRVILPKSGNRAGSESRKNERYP